jgi:hypothetical protein
MGPRPGQASAMIKLSARPYACPRSAESCLGAGSCRAARAVISTVRYEAQASGPTGSTRRESTPTHDPGRRSSAICTNGERRSFAFHGTVLPRSDQARHRTVGRPGHVSGMIKRSEPTRGPGCRALSSIAPAPGMRTCESFNHATEAASSSRSRLPTGTATRVRA